VYSNLQYLHSSQSVSLKKGYIRLVKTQSHEKYDIKKALILKDPIHELHCNDIDNIEYDKIEISYHIFDYIYL